MRSVVGYLGRPVVVAVAVALQLAVLIVVAAPRLSPRLFGEEYLLVAEPLDPIDPFRGAYVAIDYRGVNSSGAPPGTDEVFVRLKRRGRAWVGAGASAEPPADGPYLACETGTTLDCGIGSLFLSQETAKRLERRVERGGALARVAIDGSGRAALLSVEPR